MALGFESAAADTLLDSWAATAVWVKLHTGAPGAAGTSNAATETTRKQVTWNASSGGHIDNSGALTWSAVAASETYTHFSVWTASTGGTFKGSGTLTGGAVLVGQTFVVAAGDLDVSLNVAT